MPEPENQKPLQTGKDQTTLEEILGDVAPMDEMDPEFALQQSLDADGEDAPTAAPSAELGEYGEAVEDGDIEAADGEQAPAAPTPKPEKPLPSDADGDVRLSREQADRIFAMLGLGEDDTPLETVAPEPEATPKEEDAAASEPPKPALRDVGTQGLRIPEDGGDLVEMITDPVAYREHIQDVITHAVESALAAVQPIVAKGSMAAYAATRFEEKFFEEYPQYKERPNYVIKALALAQRKSGPNASWDQLFNTTARICLDGDALAASIDKASNKRDKRGRYSPAGARTARTAVGAQKKDPTQEALEEITQSTVQYDRHTASLLHDMGVL